MEMDNKSQPIDEPLQLIQFIRNDGEGNTTIKLCEDTFKIISEKAGSRPLSTICICGPSRQGKSFMLGHMIRCLEALENEETDWMDWDNKTKPLEGFKFRNGTAPETQGIWVWSRPFIVKNDEDKEIAVLLIDTQGTCDEFTTQKDMSAIVGLSLLTSSVMIFNCFNNLQEDILTGMNTYTHYGQLALNETKDVPFQKLIFLIRDWNNPDDYPYGGKGGKMFLEEKLRVKDDQPPEAREVRNTVQKCFNELDCFLMPYIGEKGITKNFKGSIAELSTNFAKKMEDFISNLISTESIVIKEILGEVVTAPELQSYLENYLEIFNSKDIPTASSMWEATSDVHNAGVVKRACQKFTEVIKKKLRGKSYLSADELETAQSAAEKQALEAFKKAKKVGSPEKILQFEEQLERSIHKEKLDIKKQNEEKRNKFLTGVISDATTQFRTLLEEDFPFDDDDPTAFYGDNEINRAANQAKHAAIEELKEKMEVETPETINKKIGSLEVIMESTLETYINRNKARRAEAEKKVAKISEEFVAKFEEEVKKYLGDNKFAELDDLKKLQEQITASTVESWKKAKKPGKKDFHQSFLTKLEKELQALSSKFENEQTIQLHEYQQTTDAQIQKICEGFEESLSDAAEDIEDEEEFEQFHAPLREKILRDFAQIHNPFPADHSLHEEFNKKLETQLDNIIEKIEREVIQFQQRVEESYLQAVQTGIRHYFTEMKEILSSSEFMSEEDLQVEHDRLMEESLQEFANYDKVGVPDNALNYKLQVQDGVETEFQKFKEENKMKRDLAKSKAQNCVSECLAKYQDLMKARMDRVRTDEQLEDLHKEALQEAREMLHENCPAKEDTDFVNHYEGELEADILDTYEELKDLFEMKRGAEDVAVKEVILDCRRFYHDEMQKYCKNTAFIRPTELEAHHKQAVAVVLDKCTKQAPLSDIQKMDLVDEMDALFEKYQSENDMKLNYTRGLAPAIGIDLGTTYCCVAVYINGEVIIIPNQKQGNAETTASYVAYNPDGSRTFGDDAKQNAFRNPENTIYDAKRILGRKINDPELQRDMKFWPFEVKEEDGIPKININGKLLFPEQVSSVLLEEFRIMVEKHLKMDPGTIKRAVITVPAYFNDGQRQATVDAGELAGLEVLTILNEPTAAAIAYSLERLDNSARKVLIFDLGGGTFDVAVLDVTSKNIQALAVNGDTHLGGEDFDQKMMEYCAQVFKDQTRIDLLKGKDSVNKNERYEARRRLRRLQNECEKAKKMLSSAISTTVSLDAMYDGKDLKAKITRDQFEELNEPDFRKAIGIVEKALKDAGLKKEDIEDIVLVGGSTRIPKVQQMLSDYFGGRALNYSIHPDQAVAYGAAVKAAMMNGEQASGAIDFDSIEDVQALSVGVEVVSKELSVIIPKNTKIPTKKMVPHYTVHDNQTSILFEVYQGDDIRRAANNELLGQFILDGIPPARAGREPVDVSMEIDARGILHVEAVCRSKQSSRSHITVSDRRQRMSTATKQRLLAEANPA